MKLRPQSVCFVTAFNHQQQEEEEEEQFFLHKFCFHFIIFISQLRDREQLLPPAVCNFLLNRMFLIIKNM